MWLVFRTNTIMQLVKYTHNSPEEAIALDELLLLKAESGELRETLRLWSSEEYFVVVGRAGKVAEECFSGRCRERGIKIIRRISGGGTVLQGPGCINYSVVLSYERDGRFKDIRYSYRRILQNIADAFKSKGHDMEVFPVSDLAMNGKKVSGNAQARKRKYFLHHGTFLFGFDPDMISLCLRHPPAEPEYRRGRAHGDFLTNISITGTELEETVKKIFLPHDTAPYKPASDDLKALRELIAAKYSKDEWNLAF